jgi:hypothetical protein
LDQKLPRALLSAVTDVLRKHAAQDSEAARMLFQVMKDGGR